MGISIAVHSLKTAERVFAEAQVPFQPFGRGSILVQPDWAAGVYLELLGACDVFGRRNDIRIAVTPKPNRLN